MSQVRLQGGVEVLSGEIVWDLVGLWTADVELDTDAPPAKGETVTIELLSADGSAVGFRGTVRTSGEYHGRSKLFVVAGAGGLGGTITAQHYNSSPTALHLIADLLAAAGETISSTTDQALLDSLTQPAWMRAQMAGTASLTLIAEAFGWDWRSLADGTIWIGPTAWTEVRAPSLYDTGADTSAAQVDYADGEVLAPGNTIQGRPIYRVTHQISPDGVRTQVTYDRSERDDWREAVRGAEPGRIYLGRFAARVLAQNADGTLELVADDTRIGGLSRIPLRYGLPGCSALVPAGERVRVAFEGGDPALAYASEWDAGQVTRLRFDGTTEYAGAAVSRVGDAVRCAQLLWDATTFVLYIAPGGGPSVGGLYAYTIALQITGATGVAPNPNSPSPPTPGTPGTPITGGITIGNGGLLA